MRTVLLLIAALMLAGCGSDELKIVDVCARAVADRMANKPYSLDTDAMRASLNTDADGISTLSGPITVDPGLSSEQKQTVECSARFESGQSEPVVISLNFIW